MTSQDWSFLRRLVKFEFKQARQEGKDLAKIDAIEKAFSDEAGSDHDKLTSFWDRLYEVPQSADFPFTEPDDLETIKKLRPSSVALPGITYDSSELYNKEYGAWIGRSAGCALGKPVEVCTAVADDDPKSGQMKIKEFMHLFGAHEYPINNYIPLREPQPKDPLKLICPECSREQIAYMQEDDDIRYTIIGQIVLLENGSAFTSDHVMKTWMKNLPYQWICTAEAISYRNLAWRYSVMCGEWSKPKVDWEWVSTYQNPWREWIGAQIRPDSYGYACPGNPELAAEFAWRDARISHRKNGIYGSMFASAMIAAAFATNDVSLVVKAGLAQIPKTSRLYADIVKVIEICAKYNNDPSRFEDALTEVNALLRHYGTVHTNSNAGICAAAVLLGQGDFEKTITIAVMAGLDTDCNGATVGSICGAMVGSQNIPGKWKNPLNDTIKGQIVGYHPIGISECADRAMKTVEIVKNNTGKAQPLSWLPDDLILEG